MDRQRTRTPKKIGLSIYLAATNMQFLEYTLPFRIDVGKWREIKEKNEESTRGIPGDM